MTNIKICINRYNPNVENSYMKTIKTLLIIPKNSKLSLKNNLIFIGKVNKFDLVTHYLKKIFYFINFIFYFLTLQYEVFAGIEEKIINNKKNNNFSNNNILGADINFYINENMVIIPRLSISIGALLFYGVSVLRDCESIFLDNPIDFNLYNVEIGKNYVKDYLLNKEFGKGFYLESHGLPHIYHFNSNKHSGYIIVAKKLNSIFLIHAIDVSQMKDCILVINPYVYHSDAYLVGSINVAYGKINDYKTYIILDNYKNIVNFEIVNK